MNSGKHAIAGVIAAVAMYLIAVQGRVVGEGLLVSAVIGALAGLLPDIVEPATDPGHRSFFHSLVMFFILGLYLYISFLNGFFRNNPILFYLNIGAAAYISHLILDMSTPAGLPGV